MSEAMSPDLVYAAYAALLTAVLWIPQIVGQVLANGMLTPQNYRDLELRRPPDWVRRTARAHLNSVESLAPFVALILIVHAAGAESPATAMWAAVYFWSRAAHATVFILGIPYVRTLAFTGGFVATVAIFLDLMS